MEQIIFKPALYKYNTCREFSEDFHLKETDLILTNEYIYAPYFGKLELPCCVVYQEKYGSGEPSDLMAEAILQDINSLSYDRIIAIGGGTIIDLAKVFAVADTPNVDELYARMPALHKAKELVIIPTTCGTGSEVTNISVLNRTRLGTKMGLVAPTMYADCAVLIPELLESLPLKVFAASSIDALVHAVESALSPKATAYTKLFSYKAIDMIVGGYLSMVKNGPDSRKSLLEDFLVASNFAGLAFGTAGCGTVHAMAYPLGGQYHVAHGESNYALFTGVMKEYLRHKADGEIAVMNTHLADLLNCSTDKVYDALEALLDHILPKKALREYGVRQDELPDWAASVMENQQRLLKNSFIPMSRELVLKIYQDLY